MANNLCKKWFSFQLEIMKLGMHAQYSNICLVLCIWQIMPENTNIDHPLYSGSLSYFCKDLRNYTIYLDVGKLFDYKNDENNFSNFSCRFQNPKKNFRLEL